MSPDIRGHIFSSSKNGALKLDWRGHRLFKSILGGKQTFMTAKYIDKNLCKKFCIILLKLRFDSTRLHKNSSMCTWSHSIKTPANRNCTLSKFYRYHFYLPEDYTGKAAAIFFGSFKGQTASWSAPWSVSYLTPPVRKKQLSIWWVASLKDAFAHKPSLQYNLPLTHTHYDWQREINHPHGKIGTRTDRETRWHQSTIWWGWTASPSGERCKLKTDGQSTSIIHWLTS